MRPGLLTHLPDHSNTANIGPPPVPTPYLHDLRTCAPAHLRTGAGPARLHSAPWQKLFSMSSPLNFAASPLSLLHHKLKSQLCVSAQRTVVCRYFQTVSRAPSYPDQLPPSLHQSSTPVSGYLNPRQPRNRSQRHSYPKPHQSTSISIQTRTS